MPIDRARTTIGQVFTQRCFYLFVALLALMMAALLVEPDAARTTAAQRHQPHDRRRRSRGGRAVLLVVRGRLRFGDTGDAVSDPGHRRRERNAAGDFVGVQRGAVRGHHRVLLRYVFQRDVITADKLYGAAAGYLMIGVLWAMLYAIASHFQPKSFAIGGSIASPDVHGLALLQHHHADEYRLRRHRAAAAARSRALRVRTADGALFLAILIARLAGVYPPPLPPEPHDPTAPPVPRFIRRLRERNRPRP